MTLIEAYKLYLALRLHFTTDAYNISETKGRVKCSETALNKNSRLRHYLEKYRTKYPKQRDFILFLVSNFVYGDDWACVYEGQPVDNYQRTLNSHDMLMYEYKSALRNLQSRGIETAEQLFDGKTIMMMYYGKVITMETAAILHKIVPYTTTHQSIDPVWKQFSRKVVKYSPFVKTERAVILRITKDAFNELLGDPDEAPSNM